MILMLIYLLFYLSLARDIINTNNERIMRVNLLTSKVYELEKQIEVDLLSYRFNKNISTLELIEQHTTDIYLALDEMDSYLQSESGREIRLNFITSKERALDTRNDLIDAINSNSDVEINRNYQKWLLKSQNINATLQDLTNYNLNTLRRSLFHQIYLFFDAYKSLHNTNLDLRNHIPSTGLSAYEIYHSYSN